MGPRRAPPKGYATLTPLRAGRLARQLLAGEYDLIVVHPTVYRWLGIRTLSRAAGRWRHRFPEALAGYLLIQLLRLPTRTPMVVVDLQDTAGVARHSFFLLDRAKYHFCRELPVDRWRAFNGSLHPRHPSHVQRRRARHRRRMDKLRPLPLGLWPGQARMIAEMAPQEKTADIFFAGHSGSNSTVRDDGLAWLTWMRDQGYRVDIADKPVPAREFYQRCARAWLVWSPSGFGWDCFRHSEAALCGSVPLINFPTVERAYPFRHGVHCFYYAPDGADLVRVAREALADKTRLARMAEAAKAHATRHLTMDAVCRHIVEAALRGGDSWGVAEDTARILNAAPSPPGDVA
jgi:hypothetical protein